MTLIKAKVQEGWVLIAYDISSTVKRNWVRRKLYYLGAMPYTASVYMIPENIQSKEYLLSWGNDNDVKLAIFNTDLEPMEAKDLNSRYKKWLKADLEECAEFAQNVWQELKEVEEALAKDDGMRINGLYKKVEGVANRFTHISTLINKFGNDNDEFKLLSLHATVEKLKNRLDRIRQMKMQVIEN